MDVLITSTKLEDLTFLHIFMEQQDDITKDKVRVTLKAVAQETSSYPGSEWEFLSALDSTGGRFKIKVSDKTATLIPTLRPDLAPDSDSELHFLASLLRQYQCDREIQPG